MSVKTSPRIVLDRKIIFSTTKSTKYIEVCDNKQEKVILKWLEHYNQCSYINYTPMFDRITKELKESDYIYYKIMKNGDFKVVSKKMIGNNYVIPFNEALTENSKKLYNKTYNVLKYNVGMSLLTKDGRKSGNAIIVDVMSDHYIVVTDYGNLIKIKEATLIDYFYIGRYNPTHKQLIKYTKGKDETENNI